MEETPGSIDRNEEQTQHPDKDNMLPNHDRSSVITTATNSLTECSDIKGHQKSGYGLGDDIGVIDVNLDLDGEFEDQRETTPGGSSGDIEPTKRHGQPLLKMLSVEEQLAMIEEEAKQIQRSESR
eukprot:g3428.t1